MDNAFIEESILTDIANAIRTKTGGTDLLLPSQMADAILSIGGGGGGGGIETVSWATSSDEEVAAMITAAHNGEISLKDYWAVGDTRTVHLGAGTNSAGTAIPAQDVELVLVHSPSSTASYGGGEFIIQQKNCLSSTNYMNSSNTSAGSFGGSAMASFLNNTSTGYLSMLPSWLRNVLLTANVLTANPYNGTTIETTTHKVFLPAEREIFGAGYGYSGNGYSNNTEAADTRLEQWTYYATSANIIKQVNDSNNYWWERSPNYRYSGYFCRVSPGGGASNNSASTSSGVAPAMLI